MKNIHKIIIGSFLCIITISISTVFIMKFFNSKNPNMTDADIEALVNQKVEEKLDYNSMTPEERQDYDEKKEIQRELNESGNIDDFGVQNPQIITGKDLDILLFNEESAANKVKEAIEYLFCNPYESVDSPYWTEGLYSNGISIFDEKLSKHVEFVKDVRWSAPKGYDIKSIHFSKFSQSHHSQTGSIEIESTLTDRVNPNKGLHIVGTFDLICRDKEILVSSWKLTTKEEF